MRAAEWAAWARSLPWRIAVILGIGLGGGVLAACWRSAGAGPRQDSGRDGRLGAAVSAQPGGQGLAARAAGERRTARLLDPLERHGWAVLHDLALPRSRANLDCDDLERGGRGEV